MREVGWDERAGAGPNALNGRLLPPSLLAPSLSSSFPHLLAYSFLVLIQDIKKTMASVSLEATAGGNDCGDERSYELPDGQVIALGRELLRSAEVLFYPALVGSEEGGIVEAILDAVMRCPAGQRPSLLANIVLTGGSAKFPGIGERIERELAEVLPPVPSHLRARVVPCDYPQYLSWLGGSTISAFYPTTLSRAWSVSRDTYNEAGPENVVTMMETPPLPDGWETMVDPVSGKLYYANRSNAVTQWVAPLSKEDEDANKADAEQLDTQLQQLVQEGRGHVGACGGVQLVGQPIPAATMPAAGAATAVATTGSAKGSPPPTIMEEQKGRDGDGDESDRKSPDAAVKGGDGACDADNAGSCEVVATQQLADTNLFVLRLGDLVLANTSKGDGAGDGDDNGNGGNGGNDNGNDDGDVTNAVHIVDKYRLSGQPQGCAAAVEDVVPPSLVIFCVDTSGSMGLTMPFDEARPVPTGLHTSSQVMSATRLQLVQAAVRAKILALRESSPASIPVIVTFGSSVKVLCVRADGSFQATTISGAMLKDEQGLLARGRSLADAATTRLSQATAESLVHKIYDLQVAGRTALGPALSIAVGLAQGSNLPGAEIVVCTDGMANNGVGSIPAGQVANVPYYHNVGVVARDAGARISVITMEGEDAGLEHLGTAADLTGGHVDVVDPVTMEASFREAMASSGQIVATGMVCRVSVVGGGALIVVNAADTDITDVGDIGERKEAVAEAEAVAGPRGNAQSVCRNVGNVLRQGTDLTFRLCLDQLQHPHPHSHSLSLGDGGGGVLGLAAADAAGEAKDGDGGDGDADDNAPDSFRCPITLELLKDPVVIADGISYERLAITDWLTRSDFSPCTNLKLESTVMMPNVALRRAIAEWCEEKGTTASAVTAKSAHSAMQRLQSPAAPLHDAAAVVAGAVGATRMPVQVEIEVELRFNEVKGGDEVIRVVRCIMPVTESRTEAEQHINAKVVGTSAIHRSAGLAQHGEYDAARINLISVQRLLQRTMKTDAHQRAYLNYVVHGEKLDQFMREEQTQQRLLGLSSKSTATRPAAGGAGGVGGVGSGVPAKKGRRDDEASKHMYGMKKLSLSSFDSGIGMFSRAG